jgi:hypothetical protein
MENVQHVDGNIQGVGLLLHMLPTSESKKAASNAAHSCREIVLYSASDYRMVCTREF